MVFRHFFTISCIFIWKRTTIYMILSQIMPVYVVCDRNIRHLHIRKQILTVCLEFYQGTDMGLLIGDQVGKDRSYHAILCTAHQRFVAID